jgi:transcriptional regulator GlxA family with amidase domain
MKSRPKAAQIASWSKTFVFRCFSLPIQTTRSSAKLGLLDGQVGTTHHDYTKPYTKEFPRVHWVSGVRFVEGPKVSTGAGVTTGIDLSLHVVERYFGRERALAVAQVIEYQGTGCIV